MSKELTFPVFRKFWHFSQQCATQARERQIVRLIWVSRDK